jgi:hypothetical protein
VPRTGRVARPVPNDKLLDQIRAFENDASSRMRSAHLTKILQERAVSHRDKEAAFVANVVDGELYNRTRLDVSSRIDVMRNPVDIGQSACPL